MGNSSSGGGGSGKGKKSSGDVSGPYYDDTAGPGELVKIDKNIAGMDSFKSTGLGLEQSMKRQLGKLPPDCGKMRLEEYRPLSEFIRRPKRTPIDNDFDIDRSKAGILGKGNYSTVYVCRDAQNNKRACKSIDSRVLEREGQVAFDGLQQEIAILHMLSHPSIISLYAYYEDSRRHYLVTDIVEGGELFDRIISKTNYTERDAQITALRLVDTLAYMYARGVVHRDLKPENILLVSKNDDTSLKIADYGYATQLRPGKPLRTICGTPGYMAPEIIRGYLEGRAKYGGKSDVYSIGVVIYVMLSGTMPYDVSGFNKNHDLMQRIVHHSLEYPDQYWGHVSQEAREFVQLMTQCNPRKRPNAIALRNHPYLHSKSVKSLHLPLTQEGIKKYQARKRWKKGINAVVGANMIKALGAKRSAANLVKEKEKEKGKGSSALAEAAAAAAETEGGK